MKYTKDYKKGVISGATETTQVKQITKNNISDYSIDIFKKKVDMI